ncbi:MAG: chorismate mutase [Syntrophomonadaceae bacterium]|mgnify:CR=1 FL=1|nr:chorismate mutase [Syntrophomonadaceae bacterium]
MMRGIRGATTVKSDTVDDISGSTQELLTAMLKENDIAISDLASAIFTATSDITSGYPARAAREMGWKYVPLLCFQEMDVKGSLPMCIRVLLLINTDKAQEEIRHIYLHGASELRKDLE